jgi:hypothetical protein
VVQLPADLVVDRSWALGMRKAGGSGGIRGRTECMRTHVADGDGLTGGPGSGRCGRRVDIARTDATGKAPADPFCSLQLAPRERSRPGDERPRAVIMRRLGLEEPEHSLCTIRGPGGDRTSLGFAQRLRRSHGSSR